MYPRLILLLLSLNFCMGISCFGSEEDDVWGFGELSLDASEQSTTTLLLPLTTLSLKKPLRDEIDKQELKSETISSSIICTPCEMNTDQNEQDRSDPLLRQINSDAIDELEGKTAPLSIIYVPCEMNANKINGQSEHDRPPSLLQATSDSTDELEGETTPPSIACIVSERAFEIKQKKRSREIIGSETSLGGEDGAPSEVDGTTEDFNHRRNIRSKAITSEEDYESAKKDVKTKHFSQKLGTEVFNWNQKSFLIFKNHVF